MNELDSKELLLVEDNPQDLELALRALAKANLTHRVGVARDGAEALAIVLGAGGPTTLAPHDRPRVIVLDLKLPKVNGLEVLKRLKAEPRTKAIPVVVLTSSKEHVDIVRSYELGANSYVVKPVNYEHFAEVVHDLGLYWLLRNEAAAEE